MYQQDYILRQIELLAKGIAKMVGIKTSIEVFDAIISEDGYVSEEQYLRYMIMNMLADGKINEAEDLLFETVEAHPREGYFSVALEFYTALSKKSEEELAAYGFSGQEVLDGLTEINRILSDRSQGE